MALISQTSIIPSGGPAFDPNTILTGPTDCVYLGPTAPQSVLIDNNGNVLTGL